MKGTFRAAGTFETRPDVPVIPVAVALLAIAIASWLATILLVLAIVLTVVAVALAVAIWLLTRRNPRDTELLGERAPLVRAELDARLQAEAAARAVPAAVENHYHLHLPPGTDARGINWAAIPLRDAVTEKEN